MQFFFQSEFPIDCFTFSCLQESLYCIKILILPDSVNHFAALKAKIFVCGCDNVCSEINKGQYFVYALTSTYCQSFMKI